MNINNLPYPFITTFFIHPLPNILFPPSHPVSPLTHPKSNPQFFQLPFHEKPFNSFHIALFLRLTHQPLCSLEYLVLFILTRSGHFNYPLFLGLDLFMLLFCYFETIGSFHNLCFRLWCAFWGVGCEVM